MRKYLISVFITIICMFMLGCTKKEETSVSVTYYTLEDIKSAEFPSGYCVSSFEDGEMEYRVASTYPTGFTKFDDLMMEFSEVKLNTITVMSSSTEDDMIYTICSAKTWDNKDVEILFINDPITKNFVAGTYSYATDNYTDYKHYLFYY